MINIYTTFPYTYFIYHIIKYIDHYIKIFIEIYKFVYYLKLPKKDLFYFGGGMLRPHYAVLSVYSQLCIQRITHGKAGDYIGLGNKPRLVTCKANILPNVLSLQFKEANLDQCSNINETCQAY